MKTITITFDQNNLLIDKAREQGYPSSHKYIQDTFNGTKEPHAGHVSFETVYKITFINDADATLFLLSI